MDKGMKLDELMTEELMQAIKEAEGLPLMEGIQKLLPVIQKLNISPQDIAELTKQLMFENPMGQQRLNPMYEARIAERAQFDGDVPELRTGAMPKGSMPAVPVDTTSLHPSLIGAELRLASEEVNEEMKLLAESSIESSTELALTQDPQGYVRGQLPSFREASEVSLATMSQEEKKKNTWHFISTTQGRNTGARLIEKRLVSELSKKGVRATIGDTSQEIYSWEIEISSGEKATHENFDYIGLVCSAFKRAVLRNIFANDLIIKVNSVNDIPSRRVGWSLSIQEA